MLRKSKESHDFSHVEDVKFDSSLDDEAGICISRVTNGKINVLKMELDEQADILYRLLTDQTAKAEIRTEGSGGE